MPALLTTAALFDRYGTRLELSWEAGRSGQDRRVCLATDSPGLVDYEDLIGNMNLAHPYRIQILSYQEQAYLASLGKNSYDDALKLLFDCNPAFIVVAGGAPVTDELQRHAELSHTALFSSPLDNRKIIKFLRARLADALAEKITLHGVFMDVMSIGVLIAGNSGVGKSELALELLSRGHRLIADDAPEFSCIAPDIINGTCPPLLDGFLEVRGLGVINVRAMFGDSVIKENKYLRLIIVLESMHKDNVWDVDRLHGSKRVRNVLDLDIPELVLPVAPGRNLAVLVEGAVLNHIEHLKGYNAAQDFIDRQGRLLGIGEE